MSENEVEQNTAEVEPAKVEPKSEPVVKDNKNGVTRPRAGTTTGRIWEISDDLSRKVGAPAKRSDVMDTAKSEGINLSTAATQYGRWRRYHGLVTERPKAASTAPVEPAAVVEEAPIIEAGGTE